MLQSQSRLPLQHKAVFSQSSPKHSRRTYLSRLHLYHSLLDTKHLQPSTVKLHRGTTLGLLKLVIHHHRRAHRLELMKLVIHHNRRAHRLDCLDSVRSRLHQLGSHLQCQEPPLRGGCWLHHHRGRAHRPGHRLDSFRHSPCCHHPKCLCWTCLRLRRIPSP